MQGLASRNKDSVGPSVPPRGFTLVELLVVIGIISILISILLPTMSNARKNANKVKCASQMKQIGEQMLMYSNSNRGWLFPPMVGVNVPPHLRWPVYVFKWDKLPEAPSDDPTVYVPQIMLCPSDARDVIVQPGSSPFVREGQFNTHTYVISHNVGNEQVTFSSGSNSLGGLTPSDFIIMGEKTSQAPDMYMGTRPEQPSFYERVLDFTRHDVRTGSNYLHLDMHVATHRRNEAIRGIDPWRFQEIIAEDPGNN
jgi:prepilin-type N-terminal cleavage/methylation domain-containing protein